jgi:DNA-binding transcriptional MerR regulator
MRSGQLAHLTGVSTDTLRHYERLGLLPLPQRTTGNYRAYPPTSQQRVELIQRALAIGFSLSELKTILAVRDGGGAPCRRARIVEFEDCSSRPATQESHFPAHRIESGGKRLGYAIASHQARTSCTIA